MKGIVQGILFGAFLFAFIGCSTAKAITHYFKSTDHFHPVSTDQRILHEPGAEKFAELVSISLPDAIKIVEKGHYSQFTKDIKIYVCATPESFENMTGRTVKAITYRKSVFLSPRLIGTSRNRFLISNSRTISSYDDATYGPVQVRYNAPLVF